MFEIVTEFCITHNSLLASFVRKKVPPILEAIHIDRLTQEQMGENFSLEFWKKWSDQKDPYKDPARAQRVISIMEEGFKKIGR
jgi:hypothetical protein